MSDLTVNGYHIGGDVADHTPGDVRPDVFTLHGHHGNGVVGGQPIGAVVAGRVVTDIVHVAEHERHGAEALQARSGPSCTQRKRERHREISWEGFQLNLPRQGELKREVGMGGGGERETEISLDEGFSLTCTQIKRERERERESERQK